MIPLCLIFVEKCDHRAQGAALWAQMLSSSCNLTVVKEDGGGCETGPLRLSMKELA